MHLAKFLPQPSTNTLFTTLLLCGRLTARRGLSPTNPLSPLGSKNCMRLSNRTGSCFPQPCPRATKSLMLVSSYAVVQWNKSVIGIIMLLVTLYSCGCDEDFVYRLRSAGAQQVLGLDCRHDVRLPRPLGQEDRTRCPDVPPPREHHTWV